MTIETATKPRTSVRGLRFCREQLSVDHRAQYAAILALVDETKMKSKEQGVSARVEVRPATYCGPGSAGDAGAWVLDVHVGREFSLYFVYRSGVVR